MIMRSSRPETDGREMRSPSDRALKWSWRSIRAAQRKHNFVEKPGFDEAETHPSERRGDDQVMPATVSR